MATPLVTGGRSSGGGGVQIVFQPPMSFIAAQAGRFRAGLLDLVPLWDMFEPVMVALEERQFDTQGGGAWPPLAESTMLQKARHGWPAEPLVRTGDLKASLTDPGRAFTKGPMHAEWGTDVTYAHYHQDGTTKMPMRQVIPDPFPATDRQLLEREMVTWINEVAAMTFGRAA